MKGGRVKFLVTGATGFIGSNLAARLSDANHDVFGVDNFSNYYAPELKELRLKNLLRPREIQIARLDLTDLVHTQELVADIKPDFIIHLAAQPGVRTPLGNSFQYIQNNLSAYGNILQTAVELEIPNFIYASSSSVYGNSTQIPYSESDLTVRPISIYGATKLANEILTTPYVLGSKTRARGLRFFTVYGPWGRPDMAYFRIINSILNKGKFNKFGDGNVKRDFTYIDDITHGIEKLAIKLSSKENGYSDVVNIGGGKPHSLNDLIDTTSELLGSELTISMLGKNPNDTAFTCADVTKFQEITGTTPKVSLEEGISETIKWATRQDIYPHLQKWVESTN